MLLLILALVFGAVVLVLLIRSISKNTRNRLSYGTRTEKVCEVLKLIALVETIAFLAIFIIVLFKTIAS